jgi:predicted nucleotidyltransferase component of viral defense system
VNKDDIKDISSSIHQRLLNKAREMDRPFNELLQYYAMERFLYRLSQSRYTETFVLKGALMLTYWEAPISRPTMDIDLLGLLDSEVVVVVSTMKEICGQEVFLDGIVFNEDSVIGERIIEESVYQGVRVKLRGSLGNTRITLQIDVGFGDAVIPAPEKLVYPTILSFPAPRILGYSRESTIAEKLVTMTRLGILNSRMKDIFDIWLLSKQFPFDGRILSAAIEECFLRREAVAVAEPLALSPEFAGDPAKATQWRAFIRKGRLDGVTEDLEEILSTIASFLTPILRAITEGKDFEYTWKPPGPWKLLRFS